MKRQRLAILWITLAAAVPVAGCSNHHDARQPARESTVRYHAEPWNTWPESQGTVLRTQHYAIHTTILDPQYHFELVQVLEGAHSLYATLAQADPSDEPFNCYVFRMRNEWETYTRARAGGDAPLYFQINRGGYTIGDEFAVFSAGWSATCRSVAHEGWHQYSARHFVDRLPPFLEEGIACLFENVRIDGSGGPTWNLEANHIRSRALRMAYDADDLFPLAELITLHAGEVVGMPSGRIEAFYAQNWAFARFLWDGENGHFRPALRKLLSDAVAGDLQPAGGTTGAAWDSRSAAPLLEAYLGRDLKTIESAYQEFIEQLIERDARRWTRND